MCKSSLHGACMRCVTFFTGHVPSSYSLHRYMQPQRHINELPDRAHLLIVCRAAWAVSLG